MRPDRAGDTGRTSAMRDSILNLTAIYGLRAMATLATLAPGESLVVADLAERTAVPQQYLSKVMRKFVVARLVRSRRGPGGGFMLARPPASITLAHVLGAIDHGLGGGCAFGYDECDMANPCALHPIWTHLQTSLASWSTGSTLADLAPTGPARTRKK